MRSLRWTMADSGEGGPGERPFPLSGDLVKLEATLAITKTDYQIGQLLGLRPQIRSPNLPLFKVLDPPLVFHTVICVLYLNITNGLIHLVCKLRPNLYEYNHFYVLTLV